jgi:lipid-binding SYLF domain-containing protein
MKRRIALVLAALVLALPAGAQTLPPIAGPSQRDSLPAPPRDEFPPRREELPPLFSDKPLPEERAPQPWPDGRGAIPLPREALGQLEGEAQNLVDLAAATLPSLFDEIDPGPREQLTDLLREARGVLLCPSVIRAGFIFGGRGGGCLLLGQANRNWSAPAFYGLGGASVGLQAGVQEMTLLMLIRTERGLRALLDGQFTLGADAGIAVAQFGGNVSGATTTGAEADLISVARARGFFAGLSLEGSVIGERPQLTSAFYGEDLSGADVVLGGLGRNGGAGELRDALRRFSGR